MDGDTCFDLSKVEKICVREFVVSCIEFKEAKKRVVTLGFRAGLGVRVNQSQKVVHTQITGPEKQIDDFIARVTKMVGCELKEIQLTNRVNTYSKVSFQSSRDCLPRCGFESTNDSSGKKEKGEDEEEENYMTLADVAGRQIPALPFVRTALSDSSRFASCTMRHC